MDASDSITARFVQHAQRMINQHHRIHQAELELMQANQDFQKEIKSILDVVSADSDDELISPLRFQVDGYVVEIASDWDEFDQNHLAEVVTITAAAPCLQCSKKSCF